MPNISAARSSPAPNPAEEGKMTKEELEDMLADREPTEDCWDCGGDGFVFDCFDGLCAEAEIGCDDCTKTCSICCGTGVLPLPAPVSP